MGSGECVRIRILKVQVCSFVFYSNGTALGGDMEDILHNKCDFEHTEQGILIFSSGETSKKITIKVNSQSEVKFFCHSIYRFNLISH